MAFSNFFKCDLHIHTDYSNITKEKDYNGKFNLDDLIKKISLPEYDIKMFSFTDHNGINVPVYENYYKNYNIPERVLFVGIELDIVKENLLFNHLYDVIHDNKIKYKKYHALLIFKNNDAKSINEKLEKMYSDISENYNEKKNENINLNDKEIKKRVTSFDRIVKYFNGEDYLVISHGNKAANIKEAYDSYGKGLTEAQNMILLGFINSLEMKPGHTDAIMHFNEGFDRLLTEDFSANKEVPYVVFSDNHEISAYPNHDNSQKIIERPFTWLKGDLTFETLRLSFVDPTSRIIISNSKPSIPSVYIESTSFETIGFDGNKKTQNISFSPGINTIIGGRSSGKSLLLNSLLYTLVNGKEESKINDYTKNGNKIIDLNSIKSKMNFSENSSNNNICDIKAFTQEGIINQFSDNGIGLKDKLPFDKIDEKELSEKTSSFNLKLEHLTASYENYFKNKNNYHSEIITNDIINSSKEIKERYIYESKLKELSKLIEMSSTKINEILLKLKKEKENLESIILIKYHGKSLFTDEEIKVFEDSISILNKKIDYLKIEYRNVFIKEKYYDRLFLKLKDISKEYFDNEDLKIDSSKNNIKKEMLKIKDYFLSKYYLFQSSKNVENISINIDDKNVSVSDNYILNTKIEKNINYNIIRDIFEEKINGYKSTISLFDNLVLLSKGELKIKRMDNLPTSFEKIINFTKSELLNLLVPKYTIIEKNGDKISVSSDNMSQGKKASVYLEILLEQCKDTGDIIIIDQPEDNIDNEFITDTLIDKIRELRMKNQVILVTHNAAITINSDSENVIIANNDSGNFTYSYDGLENKEHRQKICKLLDGGNYIFDNRYHKYNILNRKIYEPIRRIDKNE